MTMKDSDARCAAAPPLHLRHSLQGEWRKWRSGAQALEQRWRKVAQGGARWSKVEQGGAPPIKNPVVMRVFGCSTFAQLRWKAVRTNGRGGGHQIVCFKDD